MTFKDFIKSKQLCEMAFNLKEAKTITFLQLDSAVDHLLKVYIIMFFYKNIQINIILYQILYISRLKSLLRE